MIPLTTGEIVFLVIFGLVALAGAWDVWAKRGERKDRVHTGRRR